MRTKAQHSVMHFSRSSCLWNLSWPSLRSPWSYNKKKKGGARSVETKSQANCQIVGTLAVSCIWGCVCFHSKSALSRDFCSFLLFPSSCKSVLQLSVFTCSRNKVNSPWGHHLTGTPPVQLPATWRLKSWLSDKSTYLTKKLTSITAKNLRKLFMSVFILNTLWFRLKHCPLVWI